jgi:hypothetical protein
MSANHTESEIRPLSADEVDEVAGGAIHLHVNGLFHLSVGEHGASIGVLGVGVGVDDVEGAFTFTFD